MSAFTYRILKSSWGISIELEAVWQPLSEYNGAAAQEVSEKLFFSNETKYFTPEQVSFLHLGFEIMAAGVDALFKEKPPIVVVVKEISFGLCDYQDEGNACAVMGWISQEFGIAAPTVNVTFDKAGNRYDFQFPEG